MDHLADALQALRWGVSEKEWRIALTPEQAQAILDEFQRLDVFAALAGNLTLDEEFFKHPFQLTVCDNTAPYEPCEPTASTE